MAFIKNYQELAVTDSRKIVLNLLEAGIGAIQFDNILSKYFILEGDILHIQDKIYDLKDYERVFLLAFGKGSAAISGTIEKTLKSRLTRGFAIDVSQTQFEKVEFTLGTHPLPSEENLEFSRKVVQALEGLTEKDLVLIVICGGGSVLFDVPYKVDLTKLIEVNKALLSSGADIMEMNTVRKHLSKTKGGGLAGILHPAKVVSLIFSDVPGNDLSFIASGPTVKDETTIKQALEVYEKYNLQSLNLDKTAFTETPKEEGLFNHVDNILLVSNLTALSAMKEEALKWGISADILTDKFQSDAETAGKTLIEKTAPGSILLAGGETTVKVSGSAGKGGRNQHLVLSALKELGEGTTIVSFDSDGWDNTPAGGAIGDRETIKKANDLGLKPGEFLERSDSFSFFKSSKDAIITDRLPSNVADLIIVYKR